MTESAPNGEFRIEANGDSDYSLTASIRFLEGFTPAAYAGGEDAALRIAFVGDGLDRAERVGGAAVVQDGRGVVVESFGEAEPVQMRDQVAALLLRTMLEDETGEIAGRPSLAAG